MTPPVLPTPSLGNFAQDVSGAAAGFVKGLQAEKDKRRQQALAEALLQAKAMQAMRGEPSDYRIIQEPTEQGLKYRRVNMLTGELQPMADVNAPVQQYTTVTEDQSGTLGLAGTPRIQLPGQQATNIPLPPGQAPRDIGPAVLPGETAEGPGFYRVPRRHGPATIVTGGAGEPVSPKAQQFELDKAQFAANMGRAAHAMEKATPEDVDAVVSNQNIQSLLQSLPVIGQAAGESARQLMAFGLTPAQAEWLANFNTFLGFAVPELAGKQMTITEMRQNLAMFAPLLGEPPEGRAVKIGNIRFRVHSAIRASGAGWKRLMSDPGVAGQIPQEYGGSEGVQAPQSYDDLLNQRP